MRYSSLVFLCTILSSSLAFAADSINVARGVPISVHYAVNDPALIPQTNADPHAMVDGNTSTFYNLPVGQEGTRFLFDLGAEFQITTFVARGFSVALLRLRGYELEGSVDGVQWITMARDTNQLLLTATASFAPTSARFVKLTVTHMDPTRPNGVATVLSEINLWANIVFPTVYQVSLANTSSAGIRFRDVIWSSMLLDSSATVTLQYRKAGTSAAPTAVDTAIPNTGRYAWETALLLDGSYEIIVSPNGTGARVSGYGTATIDYFSNEALFLVDTAFYRYREPQYALDARTYYSTVTQAWGHSALNGDTLIFYWRFTPNVPRDYTCEFSYSTDSARTWIVLGHVPDTVAQPVRFAAPAPAQSSASTFYRVGFLAEGYEWSHAQTVVPIVLSSWPANLSAR